MTAKKGVIFTQAEARRIQNTVESHERRPQRTLPPLVKPRAFNGRGAISPTGEQLTECGCGNRVSQLLGIEHTCAAVAEDYRVSRAFSFRLPELPQIGAASLSSTTITLVHSEETGEECIWEEEDDFAHELTCDDEGVERTRNGEFYLKLVARTVDGKTLHPQAYIELALDTAETGAENCLYSALAYCQEFDPLKGGLFTWQPGNCLQLAGCFCVEAILEGPSGTSGRPVCWTCQATISGAMLILPSDITSAGPIEIGANTYLAQHCEDYCDLEPLPDDGLDDTDPIFPASTLYFSEASPACESTWRPTASDAMRCTPNCIANTGAGLIFHIKGWITAAPAVPTAGNNPISFAEIQWTMSEEDDTGGVATTLGYSGDGGAGSYALGRWAWTGTYDELCTNNVFELSFVNDNIDAKAATVSLPSTLTVVKLTGDITVDLDGDGVPEYQPCTGDASDDDCGLWEWYDCNSGTETCTGDGNVWVLSPAECVPCCNCEGFEDPPTSGETHVPNCTPNCGLWVPLDGADATSTEPEHTGTDGEIAPGVCL